MATTKLALLLLLVCTASLAQNAALDPALQEAVEARKQTLGEAQKYTYAEQDKTLNFDSKGKVVLENTETYEIIFLEGAPYKKHTLHNGKPLSTKEQKAEERKLQDVAKSRREQKEKTGLFHASFTFEFPLDQLSTRFTVSPSGEEELDGRKNLVFMAVPPAGADMKQAARDGVAYEMKFWVDRQDHVFRRIEGKVAADGMRYEKDTLVTFDFSKVNGEAWLPSRFYFKGRVRYMLHDIPDETEQTYSDYKKFHAETKVVTQ